MTDNSNNVTIDLAALDQHIADALPKSAEKQAARAEQKLSNVASFAGLPKAGDIIKDVQAVQGGFCAYWPEVYDGVNWFVHSFGWFSPTLSTKITVVMSGINDQVYSKVCKTAPK